MGEIYTGTTWASCRDEVTQLMGEGHAFGDVEDAIDERVDLTEDAKAALWLLAFSLRARGEQLRDARARVLALG